MKKVLIAILCVLVALVAFAQGNTDGSGGTPAAVTVAHDGKSVTLTTDSAKMQILVEKSGEAIEGVAKAFTADNGDAFVIYNGKAYEVDRAAKTLDSMSENILRIRKSLEQGGVPKTSRRSRIVEMLIVFGIPCLTIGVALVFLLVFLIRKNNTRTEIIFRAIENNYELPEAFYTGQSAAVVGEDSCCPAADGADAGRKAFAGMSPVPMSMRDPRAFSSSLTTIAVGLALLMFFGLTAEWGVAFLIGGIPLFIGIGKLVSYFFVPASARNRGGVPPQYPGAGQYPPQQPPYGGAPRQPYAGGTPGSQSPYGQPGGAPRPGGQQCPPPFPGEHTSAH